MPPEAFFTVLFLGAILGVLLTLAIQLYGRRKARQAIGAAAPDTDRTVALLGSAAERQSGQIDRLQERLAVLERLATDPAERTARAIDALR